MTSQLKNKPFEELMQHLAHDFKNDLMALCLHYNLTERQMLIHIEDLLLAERFPNLSIVQQLLFVGLYYCDDNLSRDDYYMYFGYVINPKYDDDYRRNTLFFRLDEIMNVGIQLEQLEKSGEWKERAINFLSESFCHSEGDVIGFVNNHWQPLQSDLTNIHSFLKHMYQTITKNIGEQ